MTEITDFVELVLGCDSWQQAQDVSSHLLAQKLIVRAEVMTADKINLLMTTLEDHAEQIESEIKELLKLEQITLHKVPLARFTTTPLAEHKLQWTAPEGKES